MQISSRPISPTTMPYVIAELGVNHDGSPDRALQLTELACRAGADAVKFQLFEADRLMSKAAKLAAYQKAAGERDPIEMLRRLELTIDQLAPCVDLAHSLGKHAIVSVFSVELVSVAEQLPWDAYKTASPDIINKPLLDALAATGKPLIVSTGAATLQEVGRACNWLRDIRDQLAVLQCVSSYPTPIENAELGGIGALADIFDGVVGYSDHTPLETTGAPAVAAGAMMLEKHVTYDKNAQGPDHSASLEPEQFRRYRAYARIAKRYEQDPRTKPYLDSFVSLDQEVQAHDVVQQLRARWQAIPKTKQVLPIEEDVRHVSRQSLVTTRSLPAGHTITRADLTIKRPGTGLPPFLLDSVAGLQIVSEIPADNVLTQEHFVTRLVP
ncbi:MAG: N-acetylneuraminate synthase family protein [Phycisphaerales bacterium]